MPKTIPREEIAYVGPRKANVHLDIRAHSNMNQTREAKERDDLVYLLRQAQRTGIRKVIEKVVMKEVQKAHNNLQVKVRQERQTDNLV